MGRESPNKGFFKWSDEEIHEMALKFKYRGEFAKHGKGAYQSARVRGILDQVCSHMTRKVKWTDGALHHEALNYANMTDFRDHSHAAYVTAHKRGLLPIICGHMK